MVQSHLMAAAKCGSGMVQSHLLAAAKWGWEWDVYRIPFAGCHIVWEWDGYSPIYWLLQSVGGSWMCTVPFTGCCKVWVGVGCVQSHLLADANCGWEWDGYRVPFAGCCEVWVGVGCVQSPICWLLQSEGGSGMCTESQLMAALKQHG